MSRQININGCRPYREGRHQTFTSSEKRCTHVGKNIDRNEVRQFKVDGEVLQAGDTDSRCDYLLLNDEKQSSYYIELKGSDLKKAIQQIEDTISMISPSIPTYTIFRRIIYRTGSHNVHDSEVTFWKGKKQRHCDHQRTYVRRKHLTISAPGSQHSAKHN